jgi:putative Holliday junction resolvase
MRFLGIDYGEKRIGIAISDDGGTLAFPKEIIPNTDLAVSKVGKILEIENIRQVVVGESLSFDGTKNKIEVEIEGFVKKLEESFQVKVIREKEFLTTVEARRYGNSEGDAKKSIDSSAAALILQRFLDRNNATNKN